MADQPQNGPNKSVLLALAGSSNQMVQLGTLAAVLVGGMGSFFQGEKISSQVHEDREKAIREIHALYSRMDETDQRQLKAMQNQQEILDRLRRISPPPE